MNLSTLSALSEELEQHPLFSRIESLEDLRFFMRYHVYAVWDFMSLLKKLQQAYAPHGAPWLPSPENGRLIRFINEIVMEEESDLSFGSESENYSSHFEIYLESMKEVQCPVDEVLSFMGRIRDRGLEDGLNYDKVPSPSRKFMRHTFEVINAGRPHEVAASFALARESVIPLMFKRILKLTKVSKQDAPVFHYYLERHAELDGDHHGPMAKRILEELSRATPRRRKRCLLRPSAASKPGFPFGTKFCMNWIRPDCPILHPQPRPKQARFRP